MEAASSIPLVAKLDDQFSGLVPQVVKDLDQSLQPEGAERAPLWRWSLWMGFWGVVVLWGFYAAFLCWFKGLNQTNMNDYYGFALWIWADLAIIALGGGAFFSGFMKYVLGKENPLKYIVPFAVLLGVCCYTAALLILGIDVGQPLRGWFIFWHANVHSMLTEVAFCLSCYLGVLIIEYIPSVLENRKLDQIPFVHNVSHNMHTAMAVFAATGAFLSFFHQGSLGGVAGVLYGRPFAYREWMYIWPTTFFLFTWSAAAFGPCFTMLTIKITELLTRKKLVPDVAINFLAKVSGYMITSYIIFKIIDTWYWINYTAASKGWGLDDFYNSAVGYGIWILFTEIILGGVVPGLLLLFKQTRENKYTFIAAILLGVMGVCLNRWVMVLQVMAVPIMSFDTWATYIPSWQEVATTILPCAIGVLVISASHRYLPIFPYEMEQIHAKKADH